jgi:hypothetical protein
MSLVGQFPGQQLLNVPIRQAVPQKAPDRQQDHFRRKPEAWQNRDVGGAI